MYERTWVEITTKEVICEQNEKGARLGLPNPLIVLVELIGIEPTAS